jgi:hypothetical protein
VAFKLAEEAARLVAAAGEGRDVTEVRLEGQPAAGVFDGPRERGGRLVERAPLRVGHAGEPVREDELRVEFERLAGVFERRPVLAREVVGPPQADVGEERERV